jgi:RHS repeat-associated protein
VGHSDEENRLVSVTTNATGHRTEYVYDGLGRRVQILEKEIAQDQTETISSDKKYLWTGVRIAEERTGDDGGIVLRRYYMQGFVDNDGTILLYTRDHLGSIRELVDLQQTVRARYDYDPYGNVTKIYGDRDSQFLYTGHYWHAKSGLYLTLYRAYDSVLGRWLSRDPIAEAGGINLYSYVSGNPINYYDSLGLYIDQLPPNPPGYDPNTWQNLGKNPNGRWELKDPNGGKWRADPEDPSHWRHWHDPKGKRWPSNSKKPWPNQKKPKKDQSSCDPNGNEPAWAPQEESAPETAPEASQEPSTAPVPSAEPAPALSPEAKQRAATGAAVVGTGIVIYFVAKKLIGAGLLFTPAAPVGVGLIVTP